jgi:predicted NBD/HSP70 family sugar kinase
VRKINTTSFHRATRTTPRQVNRQILLNLVREHAPLSRADLARRMEIGRGMVTSLVNELIAEGFVYEGARGEAPRGRKPRMLHIRTADRLALAIDIRFSRTDVMLADFDGHPLAIEALATSFDPVELVPELARSIRAMLHSYGAAADCEGIGLLMPGMVDRGTGRVLNSPQLGWRDVNVRDALAEATGLPVYVENASVACALAQMWLNPRRRRDGVDNFVYVSVSDGVGTGVVVGGEVLRGSGGTAGEFGHIPLNLEGPKCLCGLRGCLEAYTSNLATLARYAGVEVADPDSRLRLREEGLTVTDLIARARAGDGKALWTLQESARYLGIGIAGIIHAVNPARIVIGGEIVGAWDLLEDTVRESVRLRSLTASAAATPVIPEESQIPRLLGAAALVVAPVFAAPRIA